jgi:hypothetical protein
MKSVDSDEEQVKANSPEIITDEIFSNLPAIQKDLTDLMMSKWDRIKDHLVLFRIEEFAHELNTISAGSGLNYLINYSTRLGEDLEIVDLEAIRETLNEFPRIIEKIDSLIKNHPVE